MNNQYHIEGNFLTRKRGGLGDLYPVEVARYLFELRQEVPFYQGAQSYEHLYQIVADIYGIEVDTVKWCYNVARPAFAGPSSERG